MRPNNIFEYAKNNLKKLLIVTSICLIFVFSAGIWALYLSFKFLQQNTPVVEIQGKVSELKSRASSIGAAAITQSCREEVLRVMSPAQWNLESIPLSLQSLQTACLSHKPEDSTTPKQKEDPTPTSIHLLSNQNKEG